MLERSKHKMTLGALWQRWRDGTRTQSELQICGDEGMERMAHDAAYPSMSSGNSHAIAQTRPILCLSG